jgi:hypothetical protein
MKNIYKIAIPVFLPMIALSCGALHQSHSQEKADKRTLAEYKLEEMGLVNDGERVVTYGVPEATLAEQPDSAILLPDRQSDHKTDEPLLSAQVFTSKSSTEAREYKESIDPLFEDEVIIEYQAPYYKVCVGKAQGLDSAQVLLKRVNSTGFSKAWLVRIKK